MVEVLFCKQGVALVIYLYKYNMDYKNHYNKLINRARTRVLTGYYESHHIIPRCFSGTNDATNLVNLTPEEHYLAHLLLVRIHNFNHKLVSAAMMMCAGRKSNKVYGWLRRRHAIAMSTHQSGEKNSQFGKVWIYKDENSQKVNAIIVNQFIANGWKLGRKAKPLQVNTIKLKGIFTEKYIWILENENDILKEFDEYRSVSKILQLRGFKNREGNTILSNWLKSKGRSILRRRNTAEVL